MTKIAHSIFLTKKEKLKCQKCLKTIKKGEAFVAESEKHKGICFNCSEFRYLTLLKPGDAAMTRRSKKHAEKCAVLYQWNQRRKRFERLGQYVDQNAIELARAECEGDKNDRAKKNETAAIKRAEQDKIYIATFAESIRGRYAKMPLKREFEIAKHACEKHSGRVGRTANAKNFDIEMIDLAVEAHIRHKETNYENEFGKGLIKKEIRTKVKLDINNIKRKWRQT